MSDSLLILAGVLLLAYGAVLLVVYFGQSRLLYFPDTPSREVERTPAAIRLDFEPVSLTTGDGVVLDGWFVPAPGAERGVVAFFHGNAGNIGHRVDTLRILNELGLATLIVDYRGYGRSGGRPSEAGTYRDAEAVWHHLVAERDISPERIVLFGRSLGAAVAAELASRHQPGALVLESAFTSVPDLAARIYPFLPVRWLARFRYPTAEAVAQAACPVLVIHSPDDEVIPIEHGRTVFERARSPKRFLEIEGGHNTAFLESERTYMEGWEAFLAAHLLAAPETAP
ncbi:alpha/beta hydrolase [Thiohalorhabdus sp. Cl-TMA]|uniref:Alpha/beta hydrolase n=1 Tax=Thiohalorhabdus methylotrophus TaxID=3242694 RepID=A0ABV4TTY1_9GAMM